MLVNSIIPSGERVSSLLFTHCQWEDLYKKVSAKVDEEAEKERKLKELAKRKEVSAEMAKTWDNTYINIRRRRYEKRKERLKKEKEYKEKLYKKIMMENEKLQDEIRQNAKERAFYEEDGTKRFHSAFKLSEMLAERNAQVEFNEKLKKIEKEIETKYAQSIINDVKRFEEEQAEEQRKKRELKQILGTKALKMYEESEKKRIAERQQRNTEEREDMEILQTQLEQVIRNEREEIARQKKNAMRSLIENREMVEKNKEITKLEEEEENNAIRIISNGRIRISKIRKEKEEKMLSEKRTRFLKLSNTIEEDRKARLEKEEEIYQHGVEDKNKRELDIKEKEKQYQEMLREDRIKTHLEDEKRQEERLAKERELLKWEILKRFKREEINNQFTEKMKEDRKNKIIQRKHVYKDQIEYDIDRRVREKEIELEAARKAQHNWDMSDKQFLEYAYKVRDESKSKGRDTYPLDAAIYDYKKKHNLLTNERNFIYDAKVKRPEGITELIYTAEEVEEDRPKVCKCPRDFRSRVLPREDCGCSKTANGL